MPSILRSALAAVALALLPVTAAPAQPPSKLVVLATGEPGGLYYPLGGALCRLVSKERDRHGLRCLVEPSAGSGANLAALRGGDADLAIVQSRAQLEAFRGEGAFAEQGAFAELRSLASLHGEAVVVLVAKGTKLKSLKELKGKKASLGRPNSFQRLMAEATLSAAGLAPSDLAAALEMDLAQQKAALCDGQIDAAFFTGLHPLPPVQEALAECGAQMLDLKDIAAVEALKKMPFLSPQTLPAADYDGLDKDVRTVAMKATLVATTRLDEDAAYEVVKAILDNYDSLRGMHPQLRLLDRQALAAAGLTAPLHPGAARLYKDAGLQP